MEYIKKFDKWNSLKKKLDEKDQVWSFREKEIWWCSLGVNVGCEEDGKGKKFLRPVYVLNKVNSNRFIGIPITSTLKHDHLHVAFYFKYNLSTALLSQIRMLDRKRLVKKMGRTSDYLHNKMKKATADFISS